MAQSLLLGQQPASSTWNEDFVYSPTANSDSFPDLPPELEFSGTVLTPDGWLTLPGASGFAIRNGFGANEDATFPYGGVTPGVNAYLLYPRLTWDQVAGVFFTATTYAAGRFSFDVSFSGHANDKIYICVAYGNVWSTREVLTGVYGFGWNRRTYTLAAGSSTVAIVYRSASLTQATSGGVPYNQPPGTLGYPHRLRVSNFAVTNATGLPSPSVVRKNLFNDSLLTATGYLEQFARLSLLSDSATVVATVVTPRLNLTTDSVFTVAHVEAGAEWAASYLDDSVLDLVSEIEALSVSATGGFQVGSRMSLWVETTVIPDVQSQVRSLMAYTLTMTRPAIIHGRPTTPRARSATTVVISIEGSGAVIGRISPYSVEHVYPDLGGQPTYRWLSLDARRDNDTGECISWDEQDDGPSWTTPGAYRPTVSNYVMQTDANHQAINYPAVSFDSSHLDHLNAVLSSGDWTDAGAGAGLSATWLLVGSFTRFRGMLRDSCPILDYTSDASIDYTVERTASRENLPDWFDPPDAATMYTGWHAIGDNVPNVSTLTWRSAEMDLSTNDVAYRDNMPVVLAICVSGLNSYVRVTPILGSGPSSLVAQASTPREIFTSGSPPPTTVTLGKSRSLPPFNGLFGTGSMSLLEVAYYKRALTPAEADTISRYLAGVYAPASVLERVKTDLTAGKINPPPEDGPLMFTTTISTDPTYLLQDGRIGKLYDDATTSQMTSAGVPTVYVTSTDYAAMKAAFIGEA